MTDIRWMRPVDSSVPHAFELDQLGVPWPNIWPLARACGPLDRASLVADDSSERCRLCQRAVAELERQTSP